MRNRYRFAVTCSLLFMVAIWSHPADASSVLRQNIIDLLALSDSVIKGEVVSVSDGFDGQGVPFTEVVVDVEDSFGQGREGLYSFRQFGLIEPRKVADNKINLNVTPDGWPRYAQGERVLLFLYQEAKNTGLRTTVGLFQGKFDIEDGSVRNLIENEGLFQGVGAKPGTLNETQEKMVQHRKGALAEDAFVSFVRQALTERWIDLGVLYHEN